MSDSLLLRDHLSHAPAGRVFVALWGGLALIDVTRAMGPLGQVLAVTVLVAACAHGRGALNAVLVSGTAALLLNGFVVHHLGQLAWTGPSDVARAAVLLVVALVASRHTVGATR